MAGENALRAKVPTLKIEYNEDLGNPETIAPDVIGRGFLSAPSNANHSDILRDFSKQNNDLIGLMPTPRLTISDLPPIIQTLTAIFRLRTLEQFIDDIPVFRADIKAGFTKKGEMFRAVNNLAPDLDYRNLSDVFGTPADAVRARRKIYQL